MIHRPFPGAQESRNLKAFDIGATEQTHRSKVFVSQSCLSVLYLGKQIESWLCVCYSQVSATGS